MSKNIVPVTSDQHNTFNTSNTNHQNTLALPQHSFPEVNKYLSKYKIIKQQIVNFLHTEGNHEVMTV